MKIVERKISELNRAEYNPRKASTAQRENVRDSLSTHGMVAPIIVNVHKDRKDVIVGGHLRIEIWEELKNDTVPTVEVSLTLEQERELNIRLNKNSGEFDMDLLSKFFNQDELLSWGFESDDFPTIAETFGDEEEIEPIPDPVYPIVPKYNEKHTMFCIVCDSEMDETFVRNLLQLGKAKSYKSKSVAPSMVVSANDFQKAIDEYAQAYISETDDEIEEA